MAKKLILLDHQSNFYLNRIRDGKVYSAARYGDGEWITIIRPSTRRRNCDGHVMYPAMAAQLAKALKNRPKYFLGMQQYALRLMGGQIRAWIAKNKLWDLKWHVGDRLAMHAINARGEFHRLVDVLREANVLMVGPSHLRKLKLRKVVNFLEFIDVPKTNAFLKLGRIAKAIRDAYSKLPKPLVISISCGLPAGLLVDRLFPTLGRDAFLLDMGSVFDNHCDIFSRTYMHRLRKEGKYKYGRSGPSR